MDKNTDKYTDKDMDKNTDKDKDTDMDMNMNMVKDVDMELELEVEYFCKISIRRYNPYSTVWTIWDTARRKFQWRYKLVASLHDENNSCCRWNCSPNDVLAELEILVLG